MRVLFICFIILFGTNIQAQSCESIDDLKITVMGSSVALGVGGSGFGYARLYSDLLTSRFDQGEGRDWEVANISIGGNNTINILNRWQSDLLPECGRYVIYGLSLANEGIQSGGQEKFDQFRDNMLMLIDMARANDIEPIIVNNYTRGDYNETDYEFIKDINMLIHDWDVASVNVLGAIDNGAGRWADGHSADVGHPNQKGHREFSFAIVPSLFDALDDGKPQPTRVEGTSINLGRSVSRDQISFIPEETLHPFTFSIDLKTTSTGIVNRFDIDDGEQGLVEIEQQTGVIKYTSPEGVTLRGTTQVNDNEWHRITLTHYYAWGRTFLYADNTQEGFLEENLQANTFYLGGPGGPSDILYSNLFFYRSAMNSLEITALNDGEMLKSSLEIYAPLDDTAADALANLAQSNNTLQRQEVITGIDNNDTDSHIQVYPNPVTKETTFDYILNRSGQVKISLHDLSGKNIEVLLDQYQSAGPQTFAWVLSDWKYVSQLNGVVVYKIQLNDDSITGHLTIHR